MKSRFLNRRNVSVIFDDILYEWRLTSIDFSIRSAQNCNQSSFWIETASSISGWETPHCILLHSIFGPIYVQLHHQICWFYALWVKSPKYGGLGAQSTRPYHGNSISSVQSKNCKLKLHLNFEYAMGLGVSSWPDKRLFSESGLGWNVLTVLDSIGYLMHLIYDVPT